MNRIRCINLMLSAALISATPAIAQTPRTFTPNGNSVVIAPGEESILVEDGDSFWLGAIRIRLEGVDAIETGQNCILKDGRHCAEVAREFLDDLLRNNTVACIFLPGKHGRPMMSHGRYVSHCSIGGARDEINRRLLASGMAFTKEKGADQEYVSIVVEAQRSKAGIHSVADLQHPADFRRGIRTPSNLSDSDLVAELIRRWNDLSDSLKTRLEMLFSWRKNE